VRLQTVTETFEYETITDAYQNDA